MAATGPRRRRERMTVGERKKKPAAELSPVLGTLYPELVLSPEVFDVTKAQLGVLVAASIPNRMQRSLNPPHSHLLPTKPNNLALALQELTRVADAEGLGRERGFLHDRGRRRRWGLEGRRRGCGGAVLLASAPWVRVRAPWEGPCVAFSRTFRRGRGAVTVLAFLHLLHFLTLLLCRHRVARLLTTLLTVRGGGGPPATCLQGVESRL